MLSRYVAPASHSPLHGMNRISRSMCKQEDCGYNNNNNSENGQIGRNRKNVLIAGKRAIGENGRMEENGKIWRNRKQEKDIRYRLKYY